MAFKMEKPVKDFLNKFQDDLDKLQTSLKKEGDDLVKKVKQVASTDLGGKRQELEQLVEGKIRKFEPSINKFMSELTVNAKKAGVDLSELERRVRVNLQTARTKLSKTTKKTKAKTTKVAARKKTAKKTSSKAN